MADDRGAKGAASDMPYAVKDPEQLAQNMMKLMEVGAKAMARMLDDKRADGPAGIANEMSEAGNLIGAVMSAWMAEPEKFAAKQAKLAENMVELWGRTHRRFMGEKVEPLATPAPGDSRFRDPEWTENPFFDFCKQAYLLSVNWADDLIRSADGVEERTRHRAQFYLTQLTSALSPSNFPFTNPEVLRTTMSSNAENLVRGMTQLLKDLDESGDLLKIKQTDLGAFAVGKNLATTPGKVVFQNQVMQLIQYQPTTPDVHALPLMIVPPWINKFYILDLVPQKSFIRWLVDQGFTVFVVSWVNPDQRLAHKTFEDYMNEGILEPLSVVQRLTDQAKVNVMGYCVGGTLLGTTLSYMAATGDDRFNSASFLAAQVDFAQAGDLMVFIDDTQIKALEAMMAEQGYLDGSRMAAVFNMLRPKDLIWPYVVNNYLLGKQPFPFDLLYWNSDTTRMTRANHSFYLREFYQNNRLAKGEMSIGGVKLDLSKVKLPIYELAAREDHIAPAKSVFNGARMFGGPVRYVLAGSGHIAGVINPPAAKKYMHWVPGGPDSKAWPTLEDWLASAQETAGSWWPDYGAWLAGLSGGMIPARLPGHGMNQPLEDAPGSYVKG
ncbi:MULTISPECIES: class I poly(R)-hydroxyalkanoic acid synthase [Rhodomicrobium]|uniref:PHA/PHB synthase family protein n=1 Tax=Rhodomicrobium TaxID=1068 RepID=UPI001FD8835C|nr:MULTISPECIES: class I poly(R)-hydroxyalkanoic acid synthase [Rhodomicrobium]